MFPFELTLGSGPLFLTESTSLEVEIPGFHCFEHMDASGKFSIRLNQSTSPSCMLDIICTEDEILKISHFSSPYCIFLQFKESLKMQVGSSGTRIIHERGAQMFQIEGKDLILFLKKNLLYQFAILIISPLLLNESIETFSDGENILNDWPPDGFLYSRFCIMDKEVLQHCSLVFFADIPKIAILEVQRAIVHWFLQRKYIGKFQPAHLSIEDVGWFYLQKNLLIPLALKHISYHRMVEMSGLHNKGLFRLRLRLCYGIGIAQLIREVRMAAAVKYLKDPDLAIKQIAGLCGFQGVNYFTRVFSHYFDISPNEFRKLCL